MLITRLTFYAVVILSFLICLTTSEESSETSGFQTCSESEEAFATLPKNNVSLQIARVETILTFVEDMSSSGFYADAVYVLNRVVTRLNKIYTPSEIDNNREMYNLINNAKRLLDSTNTLMVLPKTSALTLRDKFFRIETMKNQGNIDGAIHALADIILTNFVTNGDNIIIGNWVFLLKEITRDCLF